MKKRSVAILDIRSSQVVAVVGSHGVNHTFAIKSNQTCSYDGYSESEWLDVASFMDAVHQVVKATISSTDEKIKCFYVGVPGEFLKVITTEQSISFSKSKRVTASNVDELVDVARPKVADEWTSIAHDELYFTLSDQRRVINPIDCVTDSLQGKITFYHCKNSFITTVKKAFQNFGVRLQFIPLIHAESMYLFSPEIRDDSALLLHLGYISSSFNIVQGNGVAFSESFSIGVGHAALYLSMELDIPYEVAELFMKKVNLNAIERKSATEEVVYEGKTYRYMSYEICQYIRNSLDYVCEMIQECLSSYSGKILDDKTIFLTGEDAITIRGTAHHLASRLSRNVEIITPPVPYYDKTQWSSTLSLLNSALLNYEN